MSTLIVLIGNELDAPWAWRLTGSDKLGLAVSIEDKAALSQISAGQIFVVIPGTLVGTRLHAPENLTPKQWRQAAGFSIEDNLAASLEKTHIAYDIETHRLAVIAKDDVTALLAALTEAGLSPDIICADYESCGQMQNFVYSERLVQSGTNGLGFSVETTLASQFLDAGQSLPLEINDQTFTQRIGEALDGGHKPLNLRQGEFANLSKAGLSAFKRSALLAAGLALTFFAVNLGSGYNYARKTAALNTQSAAIYTKLFPDTKVPKNPALAIIRAQAAGKSQDGEGFIQTSAILAVSVKQVQGVEVSSLRYDENKGQLNLTILYDSFEDVERLKQAAAKNGGIFTEGGTRQDGERLSGNAVLGAGS